MKCLHKCLIGASVLMTKAVQAVLHHSDHIPRVHTNTTSQGFRGLYWGLWNRLAPFSLDTRYRFPELCPWTRDLVLFYTCVAVAAYVILAIRSGPPDIPCPVTDEHSPEYPVYCLRNTRNIYTGLGCRRSAAALYQSHLPSIGSISTVSMHQQGPDAT